MRGLRGMIQSNAAISISYDLEYSFGTLVRFLRLIVWAQEVAELLDDKDRKIIGKILDSSIITNSLVWVPTAPQARFGGRSKRQRQGQKRIKYFFKMTYVDCPDIHADVLTKLCNFV